MSIGSRRWLAITLLSALLDWIAVGLSLLPLEYLAKPATLLGLIGYAHSLARQTQNPHLTRWLQVGLVFSLLGDICLMFEGENWFLAGLLSFLLAHVAYILALSVNGWLPKHPGMMLIGAGVGLIAFFFLGRVIQALHTQEQDQLIGPVLFYGGVISAMLITAWSTLFRPTWPGRAQALALSGTSLFYFSDATLAWNRFVAPLPAGRLLVIVSYHLAQAAIASLVAAAPSQG